MKKLQFKQPLQDWTTKEEGEGIFLTDFDVINENKQIICKVFEREPSYQSDTFPTKKEAKFNSMLIKRAPKMAQALADLHSQLIDDGFEEDHVLFKGIESALKGLVNGN